MIRFSKKLRPFCVSLLVTGFALNLSGCLALVAGSTAAGVGAYIGSDSRSVGTQYDDQKINHEVFAILKSDSSRSIPKNFSVDSVTLNGNVLLVGESVDGAYINECLEKIVNIQGVKRVFNFIKIREPLEASVSIKDAYITSKAKSLLLTGSNISSGRFKVLTENAVVYLMGYVTRDEGNRAINQVRKIDGVRKIHPIFDYMDATGTPNSSEIMVNSNNSASTSSTVYQVPKTEVRSSSMGQEAQVDIDNGGAVLEEDTDLLAPSKPARSL